MTSLRVRLRQISALAPATARSMRWLPPAMSWLGVGAIAGVFAWHRNTSDPLEAVRSVGFVLCLGNVFALDDPSIETTSQMPTTVMVRRVYRVCLALVPAVVAWSAAVMFVSGVKHVHLPLGPLVLEAVTLISVTLALAAIIPLVVTGTSGGLAAGPGLLSVSILSAVLPPKWTFLRISIGGPGSAAASHRVTAACAGAVLGLVLASRDVGWPRMNRFVLARRQADDGSTKGVRDGEERDSEEHGLGGVDRDRGGDGRRASGARSRGGV